MNNLFLFIPAIILLSLVFSIPPIYGPLSDPVLDDRNFDDLATESKAIPDWVKNNFKWYVDGAIDQKSLLTSMNWLLDNNYMHLSDKAAKDVDNLRTELTDVRKENTELRKSLGDKTEILTDKIKSTRTELASKIDLDPTLETKIIQYDKEHDKWIAVLSVNWGSDGHVNVIDITSKPEYSSDTIVFPHLLESTKSSADERPTEEVAFYFNKISFASDTVDDILAKGGSASNWSKGITAFSQQGMSDSTVDDLQGIVVLCNHEVSKKTQTLDAELNILGQWLDIIEKTQTSRLTDPATGSTGTTDSSQSQYRESDLDFLSRKLASIDQQIIALDTGINVMKDKLSTVGDDAQMANIDLQNALQKQQQTLQTLSNVSKNQHDTLKSIIQNMRA